MSWALDVESCEFKTKKTSQSAILWTRVLGWGHGISMAFSIEPIVLIRDQVSGWKTKDTSVISYGFFSKTSEQQ
jgi:hypothetical protein